MDLECVQATLGSTLATSSCEICGRASSSSARTGERSSGVAGPRGRGDRGLTGEAVLAMEMRRTALQMSQLRPSTVLSRAGRPRSAQQVSQAPQGRKERGPSERTRGPKGSATKPQPMEAKLPADRDRRRLRSMPPTESKPGSRHPYGKENPDAWQEGVSRASKFAQQPQAAGQRTARAGLPSPASKLTRRAVQ